jgi:predicted MFS family arabinose efflux permease
MLALVALGAAYVFSQFFRSFLAIVAADLTRDIGLGPADLGGLSAIWFAAFALAQPIVGLALDRFGPRRTVATMMLAAVAGSLLFASAAGLATALAGMALIGVGCAPVLMGMLYLIGRVYPPTHFAVLSAVMLGVSSLGNLVSATPLALAAAAYGWRATFVAIAGVVALVAASVALAVRDPPRVAAPANDASAGLAGFLVVLRTPGLALLLPLVTTSYAVVIAERSLWIGPFLEQVHGLTALERANAAFVMATAMTVASFAYAPAERLAGGGRRVVLVGTAVAAAAFAALALPVPALGAVALLAAAGGFGLTYTLLMAHGRRFFPDHLLGRGVTTLNFAFIGGAAVLQAASGLVVEALTAWGASPAATFATLHLGFSGLLAVSLAVYAKAPDKP